MSNNPYSPGQTSGGGGSPAENEIKGPAISLIVVASIALGLGVISLIFDAIIVATGMPGANQNIPRETQLFVRISWGILLLISSTFVLYASIQMLKLRNYSIARAGAIVAVIPCVGPCCILGIPFGIWAIVVLNKEHIKRAFR